jgi:3-methyladenine DNA glycosylase AlkD
VSGRRRTSCFLYVISTPELSNRSRTRLGACADTGRDRGEPFPRRRPDSVRALRHQAYHDEVAEALIAIGDPDFGEAVRQDRDSELVHLGIRFPELRRRVKQGFSFYDLPEAEVLAIWDALWQASPYGDVLFAALEYYAPIVRKRVPPELWPVLRQWSDRVDNWCHSDLLSGVYSRVLDRYPDEVFPQIEAWNAAESEWLRRISIVSLVHYSGKNAVFLRPDEVLPLVSNCVADPRHYVQTAVGWVLREMGHVYPEELASFLETHGPAMSAAAFSRAIERRSPDERARLRAMRKMSMSAPDVRRP